MSLLLAVAASAMIGQAAQPEPSNRLLNSRALAKAFAAIAPYDPLNGHEWTLHVFGNHRRVTVQLFRTDGRQKVNVAMDSGPRRDHWVVGKVRIVPPMKKSPVSDNRSAAFAAALPDILEYDYVAKGLIRVFGGYGEDTDPHMVSISVYPFNEWNKLYLELSNSGQIVRCRHGY